MWCNCTVLYQLTLGTNSTVGKVAYAAVSIRDFIRDRKDFKMCIRTTVLRSKYPRHSNKYTGYSTRSVAIRHRTFHVNEQKNDDNKRSLLQYLLAVVI